MELYISLILIFFSAFFLFYIIASLRVRKRKMNERIETFIPLKSQIAEEEIEKKKESPVRNMIFSMSKAFRGLKFSVETSNKLERAGSLLKPEEFLVVKLLTSVGTGFLLFILGINLFIVIGAALLGLFIPGIYMTSKAKKRLNSLSFQLVEALATMSNAMRAGFSFMQSMQLVGKEMPDPIGPEFERVIREVGLGIPIEDVFESLIERLPNKELEVVVQAIMAQRQSGGNLAELLETMEETIRGRIRILEELKTLTAQGRMSSWIITLLPVALALYMYTVSPDYFTPMLGHPLGIVMLVMASLSIIIGWFLIQRVVKIEV